jgi:hypothetical protein
MSSAKVVTAAFTLVGGPVLLTVAKSGTGRGTVSAGNISCGSTCPGAKVSVPVSTTVTLTATATFPITFGGWTGCASTSGTNGSICTVTMSSARTVTANFVR